jgi:glucose/arabinose dehydrogenase
MRAVATALGVAAVVVVAAAPSANAGSTGVETRLLANFQTPTFVAPAPSRPRYLYVTEKAGIVRVIRDSAPQLRPFLNLTDLVADDGEQGLLSIAFPPDHRKTRRFYVYYTASAGCTPAGGCPIRVDEFKTKRGDPARALRSSRRRVIQIPHPDAGNHNGGTVAFGPDGKLWLATGDGGGGGDQFEQSRDPESLLGKLLRINPRSGDPRRPGYRVPADNPFVNGPGRDEIWSYGLRNPFRFSFDAETGVVAIGDVGQGTQEEVSIVTIDEARGRGFGWPEWEGTFDFAESPPYTPPDEPLFPMFTYPNPPDGASAVTGGVIAHDPELPQLEGRYLTGDFYAGQVGSFVPDLVNNEADDVSSLDIAPVANLVAFASGLDGQLYVLSMGGELYRLEPEQG